MTFFLALLVGAVGGAYLIYGKKTTSPGYLIAGAVLSIYPYFVSNAFLLLVIGIAVALYPVARDQGWFE